MRTRSLIFLALLGAALAALTFSVWAQSPPIEWITHEQPWDGRGLVLDGYGDVYVGCFLGAIIKYDWAGVQQWSTNCNFNGGLVAIARSSNGNIYATGGTNIETGNFKTVKLTPDGVLLWTAVYNGPGNALDYPSALALDSMGNVYITGRSYGLNQNLDYATVKYNAAGVQQWAARYDGPAQGEDWPYSIDIDNQGNVYVTGYCTGDGNIQYYCTIKYDPDGRQLWVELFGGVYYNSAFALKVDGNGNVYVTGGCMIAETLGAFTTVKYNTDGIEQWVDRYVGGGINPQGLLLALDRNGNPVASGKCQTSSNLCFYCTIKFDTASHHLWEANIMPETGMCIPSGLVLDDSDNVYVTGQAGYWESYELGDFATVKYNAQGQQQWLAIYDAAQHNDWPNGIAVDRDHHVYVTGYAPNYPLWRGTTIKYNQGGPAPNIVLTPRDSSIVIPPGGGSFQFNATAQNNGLSPYTLQVWIMQHTPSGQWQGPMLGPLTVTVAPVSSLTRLRTQNVPWNAPPGQYIYRGYLGHYPSQSIDSSSFTYLKSAWDRRSPSNLGDWSCTGESFPGESQTLSPQPSGFSLCQAVPNPFNPTTVLSFELRVPSLVSLNVYDITGRLVTTLVEGWREMGTHEVTFDGSKLASGIYLASMEAGDFTAVQKLVLMK